MIRQRSTSLAAKPPPATSGTVSASSTHRYRAGGCGSSTPPSSGRLLDRLSGLAAGLFVYERHISVEFAQRSRGRPRGDESPAQRHDGETGCCKRQRDLRNPETLAFARAFGRSAFGDNCAPCHGSGGAGAKGYANLVDDDWLWGGKLKDIETTIRHGIRSADPKGRQGSMPAFGRDGDDAASGHRGGRRPRAAPGRAAGRAGGRPAAWSKALLRQLRGVSRRRRQGASATSARRI